MATDKEGALPIETWDGLNVNTDSEDIAPEQFVVGQNLWERTLGQLETRWGSATNQYASDEIADQGLGQIYKIYKSPTERVRFASIQCTPEIGELVTMPTGCVLQFANQTGGYWNKDNTFGASTESGIAVSMTHANIVVRFVGYGVDQSYTWAVTGTPGYNAATAQKLQLIVDPTFDNSKITGIEVYAVVKCGDTVTPATVTTSSAYQLQTMWVGFMDVTTNINQTKDFWYSPAGYKATIATTTTIGSSERSFVAKAFVTGTNNVSGTFIGGKTYYLQVLPQYTVFDGGTDNRCCYRNPTVDVYGGNIVPVTIPGNTTGYITIDTINPNTVCFLIAVGETPQTLQPYCIFNNSEIGGGASTSPTVLVPGTFWLENPLQHNPGVIDFVYSAEGLATLSYRFSDYSRHDMFQGINDDGSRFPIFCSRLYEVVNSPLANRNVFGNPTTAPGSATTYPWMWYSINALESMQKMGDGSRYRFAAWRDYCLFVNDYDPLLVGQTQIGTSTWNPLPSRTKSNYYICDGSVAAPVIEDWQTTKVTLPNMKFISKFDTSIVLGGGTGNIDPTNGGSMNSGKILYYSRSDNPFDFTIPGAAATTHQTVALDDDGEDITGFGIYTNTTSDQGPVSQLVTTKKNATWIMNGLPTADDGVLSNFSNRLLSKKVGGFHDTIVNTPIGTVMAAYDNVYILRESGEPVPVGQCVAAILKGANMSKAVACYHDKHYKLAFSHPDYSGWQGGDSNNVELWLNINKVIEKKGGEDWVGPMVGRAVDSTFVEDRDGDGITYNLARDRYCIDKYQGTGRIYRADVAPGDSDEVLYDLNTATFADDAGISPVVSTLKTKTLDITAQDNNWNKLLKRFYVKMRSNWGTTLLSAAANYTLWVDGVQNTAVDFGSTVGAGTGVFYSKPLTLVRIFPVGRLRGRTVQLQVSFNKRVGLGGLQINFQIERRRI